MVGRMRGGENFRNTIFVAIGFLKHRELIGPDGLVFVHSGLHVPAGEVAAIGTRERAGAKAADGRALPKTVVDMASVEGGLFCAGIFEGLADGALPGGFGTLDELFEAVTLRQLGYHDKPGGILVVAGYDDGLRAHLERAASDGFVHDAGRATLFVDTDPLTLIDALLPES